MEQSNASSPFTPFGVMRSRFTPEWAASEQLPLVCERCSLPFDRTGGTLHTPTELNLQLQSEGREPIANTACPRFLGRDELWTCDGKQRQPFRAGDAVEVLVGDSKGERWVIAVYEAATDSAYIAGWPCTLVTKASEALRLHRAATDAENASMLVDLENLRGDHGGLDPRASALRRIREAGGTP